MMMILMMIWNGYNNGKKNRNRRLCNIQEDSGSYERRLSSGPSHSHSLQNVEGWTIEYPKNTTSTKEVQGTKKKRILSETGRQEQKKNVMGRLHL